ncbi:MAG: hypothetical protein FWF26_03450, partial [Treponema sp.]|nr:hypothetical protein [Treponema sp.]
MMEERTEILCIGNALVDVFVCLDEQTANRLGITEPVQHVEIQKLREILDELPDKSNTACPQGNVSLTGISSGGAHKTHARYQACPPGKSNTACPQGNVSLTGISSGGGA